MENKNEFPEEVKNAAEIIAKWLSEDHLYESLTIYVNAIEPETGSVGYTICLG